MQTIIVDKGVLASQGSAGSYGLGVPNPAPGIGADHSVGGGADGNLSVAIPSPQAGAAIHMPDQYGSATNGVHGGTGEPASLYSIGGMTKMQGS